MNNNVTVDCLRPFCLSCVDGQCIHIVNISLLDFNQKDRYSQVTAPKVPMEPLELVSFDTET
jgi:hypothetical protein